MNKLPNWTNGGGFVITVVVDKFGGSVGIIIHGFWSLTSTSLWFKFENFIYNWLKM
jgi:hypothetical protein